MLEVLLLIQNVVFPELSDQYTLYVSRVFEAPLVVITPTPRGRLQYEMPGYICMVSENVPIKKDPFSKDKTYPY